MVSIRLQVIAESFGLDTNQSAVSWKDLASVILNMAIIHSFKVCTSVISVLYIFTILIHHVLRWPSGGHFALKCSLKAFSWFFALFKWRNLNSMAAWVVSDVCDRMSVLLATGRVVTFNSCFKQAVQGRAVNFYQAENKMSSSQREKFFCSGVR